MSRREFLALSGFGVAALAFPGRFARAAARAASAVPAGFAKFVTEPSLKPPTVTVTTLANPAPGHLFVASLTGPGQRGPMIFDNHGRVVWFRRLEQGRDQLSPADLRREARAHLVGGRDLEHRHRPGRRRDRRRHLRDGRACAGGERLPGRRARVPADRERHSAHHDLQPGARGPLRGRRPVERDRARFDRAGGRRQVGTRSLRVAQPRPRPAHRHVLAGARPVRLLPHQLGRRRPRRQPAAFRAEHLGAVQGRPLEREGALAPRRPERRLRARPIGVLHVPARRARALRRHDHPVRRRARAVVRAVARNPARHRPRIDARQRATGLPASRPARVERDGQRPGARRKRDARRLGHRAVHHGVRAARGCALRREVRRGRLELPRISRYLGRAADDEACRRGGPAVAAR